MGHMNPQRQEGLTHGAKESQRTMIAGGMQPSSVVGACRRTLVVHARGVQR